MSWRQIDAISVKPWLAVFIPAKEPEIMLLFYVMKLIFIAQY